MSHEFRENFRHSRNVAAGEAIRAHLAGQRVFFIQHGHDTSGPFLTESAQAKESWKPQKKRGNVVACRFVVLYRGRWRRLYSEHDARLSLPHFINHRGERLRVSGVCP